MNEWDRRIREHPVWETMESPGITIDDAVKITGSDPLTAVGLERIRSALAFVGKRFAGADPFISPLGPFDAINAELAQVRDYVGAFASGQDAALITNANGRIDAVLSRAFEISAIATPEELGALIQSAVAFRKDFETHLIEALRSESENRANAVALRTALAGLSEEIQREREQLNLITTDYQRQFSEGQERRTHDSGTALLQAQQELIRALAVIEVRLD